MQLLINVLALSSFIVSSAIVGGSYYVYNNKEALIDTIKAQVIAEVTGGIMPSLPGLNSTELPIDSDSVLPDVNTSVPMSIPTGPLFN